MTRLWACCVVLSLATWGISFCCAAGEGPCDTERAEWLTAHSLLKEGMESYQQVKQEPITPRIEGELERRKAALPVAQIVRNVLNERGQRMDEAKAVCRDLGEAERRAFETWRRCATASAKRAKAPDTASPDSIARERNQLLTQFQDLLLDEGYLQYKTQRDPDPSAYSSYESTTYGQPPRYQRSWGPQTQWPGDYSYQGYYR